MSKHGKRDVLVHFDEEKNEFVLYAVAVGDTKDIRAREFDGARLDLPYFLEMSPDQAEKILGETIFGLVDTFATKKTGIRPYEALAKERHNEDIAEWEISAKQGDPQAQYMLFIEYHSRALFNCDGAALTTAEEMLEAAAAQGYQNAVEAKSNWPLLRSAVEKKLKRTSSS
jgi:hypothetical protein